MLDMKRRDFITLLGGAAVVSIGSGRARKKAGGVTACSCVQKPLEIG
jgi:hypothetical protein